MLKLHTKNVLTESISNDLIASPFLTDNDKLEATEMDEDVSLAFLPCGSSKLVFAKVSQYHLIVKFIFSKSQIYRRYN